MPGMGLDPRQSPFMNRTKIVR